MFVREGECTGVSVRERKEREREREERQRVAVRVMSGNLLVMFGVGRPCACMKCMCEGIYAVHLWMYISSVCVSECACASACECVQLYV